MNVAQSPYPGPRRLRFGHAEIWEVEEIAHKKPLAQMTRDPALIASLPTWMFPVYIDADMQVDVVTRCWIVIAEGRVIVIDPCTGNGRDYPHFPAAHRLETPFIDRFAATGICPEDVDIVFCTHLHMDHCGWNTVLRDGRFVPTFPNARYVMMQRELERWDPRRAGHVPVPPNSGTFENSVQPVLEAGLVQIVSGRHAICRGVTVEPSSGHTIGHSSLHLASGGLFAHFVGDVFHHAIEMLHPDLDDQTGEDFPALERTRRRAIARGLAEKALIIPAHFPCPFGGRLHERPEGLTFDALELD